MEGLHHPRPCGCKGVRSCLLCEAQGKNPAVQRMSTTSDDDFQHLWRYCYMCGRVQPPKPGADLTTPKPRLPPPPPPPEEGAHQYPPHCHEEGVGFLLRGIRLMPEFITDQEEKEMVHIIEQSPWKQSQSGRMKQDYGPKPNFKRRKVKTGGFTGLPAFSKPFVSRMTQLPVLHDFIPVEQCHLEYTPDRGSAIDLHFDDFWLWGDRLVTINLLSDTFLLLKLDQADAGASWDCDKENSASATHVGCCQELGERDKWLVHELAIPMPRKSLLVLSDDARYKWKHAIPRGAISARRIAVTLRELAPVFLPGGSEASRGQELLDIALTYEGLVVL